ncbi:kelch-like protein 25 [Eurytemora carolleeae]|uniref:kelch-like protein 25 n=1 Tax=Eurytemora carolleeae TaxID=1294199 RepID=UPI000C780F15|nr:kelch-like protein 25 [Eurytemora carolleeae]|eukprot:XP_023330209.1 kelch-like protein 25 [Eurytemora affinis]
MFAICILGLISGTKTVIGGDVLMVIGGQFFNASSREHETVSSVEIIGENAVCEIDSLPTPLYGMSAGRVGDRVYVCGGFYYYYRLLCYEYSRTTGRWTVSRTGLESANAYMASYSAGNQFYLAGGRDYRGGDGSNVEDWLYTSSINKLQNRRFEKIANLPEPIADGCIVVTNITGKHRLWLIGGSNIPQRYKSEVYSLDLGAGTWSKQPDMPEQRMWPACIVTTVEGTLGILVAGGYFNGGSSIWLPLVDRNGISLETYELTLDQPRWEWLSSLTMARKWGSAIGYVNGKLTLAGGGDYGDNTIEHLIGRDWLKSNLTMKYKREFTAGF